jgi:hypothetical protein
MMTKRSAFGAALLLAGLLATWSTGAAGQSLASIAAAATAGSASVQKSPGCWGCGAIEGITYCQGGHVPGYFNCATNWSSTCSLSSSGCGGGASLPLDPDGATQYVSRGAVLGVEAALVENGRTVKRNCDGVIVARHQTSDNIASVRARTASLTL